MELNRFNSVTWATQNPHVYVEKATQNKAGVKVWVGLIKDHIIGPFFFEGSVNGDIYLQLLQTQVGSTRTEGSNGGRREVRDIPAGWSLSSLFNKSARLAECQL